MMSSLSLGHLFRVEQSTADVNGNEIGEPAHVLLTYEILSKPRYFSVF